MQGTLAREHVSTQGTWAHKHARHVGTWARKHARHIGTWAREHASHVGTWARKTRWHGSAFLARRASNLADLCLKLSYVNCHMKLLIVKSLCLSKWAVISHLLTHTHPHPARKRSHLPTPTHTKPRKGHTHPHPPTPSQKKGHTHPHPAKKRSHSLTLNHTQPKEGHTHPHITEINNITCLTHTNKYSLFTILAGVFIFERDWPVHFFPLNTFETAFESIARLFVFNN